MRCCHSAAVASTRSWAWCGRQPSSACCCGTRTVNLEALATPALFVPRTVTLMAVLQQFKQMHLPIAFVVDEFGGVNGLVSLTDVTAAIVGELPETREEDPSIIRRDDGSYLVDGSVEVAQLERQLRWAAGAGRRPAALPHPGWAGDVRPRARAAHRRHVRAARVPVRDHGHGRAPGRSGPRQPPAAPGDDRRALIGHCPTRPRPQERQAHDASLGLLTGQRGNGATKSGANL